MLAHTARRSSLPLHCVKKLDFGCLTSWWGIRWLFLAELILLALADGSPNSISPLADWISIDRFETVLLIVVIVLASIHAKHRASKTCWLLAGVYTCIAFIDITSFHLRIAHSLNAYLEIELVAFVPTIYVAKTIATFGIGSLILAFVIIAYEISNSEAQRMECVLLLTYAALVGAVNVLSSVAEAIDLNWTVTALIGGSERFIEVLIPTLIVGFYASRLLPTWRLALHVRESFPTKAKLRFNFAKG